MDIVDHEDISKPLLAFVPDILKYNKEKECINLYLTSGETHNRENRNLLEAMTLSAKRIS
jgi:hypothetical protein